MRQRRGTTWGAVLCVGLGIVVAACQPLPPPAPPPPPPPSPQTCGTQAKPSPADPVEYVAVVDAAGESPEVVTFTATSDEQVEQKVDELEARGDVVALEQDAPVAALADAVDESDDDLYPQQWALTGSASSMFSDAWTSGHDGLGVTIAVIDSGVLATHEDLAGKVLPGVDYVDSTDGRVDPYGHGTHVAGIAAATDNDAGVLGGSPDAQILPVRVLNASGSGSTGNVASGIIWAVDNGADVVNLSLGGSSCSTAMQAAVAHAEANNVVVAAAAGNDGASSTLYPAAFDGEGVIAVAATNNSGAKAGYSNFGASVDLAAPGGGGGSASSTGILSSYIPGPSTYAVLNGTSMATPLVAAAAALLVQRCPGITPAEVLSILQATDVPVPNHGFGRLQAGGATAASCPP